MSQDPARPWWASDDPATDRLDPDEDPVSAARGARQRADGGTRADDRTRDDRRARTDERSRADDPPPAADQDVHDAAICGVCPLCSGWRLLSEVRPEVADHLAAAGRHLAGARPEVAEHLAAAGRHLASAIRHLVEDVGTTADGASAAPGHNAPFERIDVDAPQGQEPAGE